MNSRTPLGIAVILLIAAVFVAPSIVSATVSWYTDGTFVDDQQGLNLLTGTGLDVATSTSEPNDSRVSLGLELELGYRLPQDCAANRIPQASSTPDVWVCAASTGTATRGAIPVGTSTPAWDALVIGTTTGQLLAHDGTDVLWSNFGDVWTNQHSQLGNITAYGSSGSIRGQGMFYTGVATDASSGAEFTSDGVGLRGETNTTLDNAAGVTHNNAVLTGQGNPRLLWKYTLQHTTNVRFFVGMVSSNSATTVTGSDAPSLDYAGIQYSTGRGDSNWQCVSSDGTGQQITDTTVAVSTAAKFVRVRVTSSQVYIQLLDRTYTIEATCGHTTEVPTSTDQMYAHAAWRTLSGGEEKHVINYYALGAMTPS